MSAFGLAGVPTEKRRFYLWPENHLPLSVFSRLSGAWRTGPMGGVLGLDWQQVQATLGMMGIPRRQWPDVADAIREAEREALSVCG